MPELGLTSLFENLEQPSNNDFKSMSTTFKYSPEPEREVEQPKKIVKKFSISRPKLSKTPKYSSNNNNNNSTPKFRNPEGQPAKGKPIKIKNVGRTKLSTYAPVVCNHLFSLFTNFCLQFLSKHISRFRASGFFFKSYDFC